MVDAPFKRLSFGYDPHQRESVIGALAQACHAHRLPRISSALEGGGIPSGRAILIQCASDETLRRLARILRTDVARLSSVAFSRSGSRHSVLLGDLIAPRSCFEFERRWIGPLSLDEAPFHRSAWLNRLLPYCPESLELLVQTCPTCGPLGWHRTRGVHACENCGEHITPSTELPLPPDHAEDYRLFSDLMSRDVAIGAQAVERLPANIRRFSRTTLTGIAVRSSIVSGAGRTRWGFDKLIEQSPETVAGISSAAAALLRKWPQSIQQMVDARMAVVHGDLSGYERVRSDIRWIARGIGEEGREFVASAFPNVDGRKVDTFAKTGSRYYTASKANAVLRSTSNHLAALRGAEALSWEELPSGKRKRARYDADDVDELRLLLCRSISAEGVAARLEVPVYAVGQLVKLGLLKANENPGALLLQRRKLDVSSFETFTHDLEAAAIRGLPPRGYTSLRSALIKYPGEKPWARVLSVLLKKGIPFFVDGSTFVTARNMHVDPMLLGPLPLASHERSEDAMDLTFVSMRDASEILGAGFDETTFALTSAKIATIRHGKGKGVPREAVQHLAARISFTGESALFSNRTAVGLYHQFTREGVPKIHGGWCRQTLVERGLALNPGDMPPAE